MLLRKDWRAILLLPVLVCSLLISCSDSVDPPRRLGTPVQVLPPVPLRSETSADDTAARFLANYTRVSGIAGNLSSAGSDTLANLMTLWAEAFKRQYPGVNIQVQAAGSSTAPPALTEGTVNFGPMSRAWKDAEVEAFESRYGYKPTAIQVAVDAVAVYVHEDNPMQAISLAQLDAMFSITRRCGAREDISEWGQAGLLDASWSARPIQLFGRNSVSGTYGYFKSVALCSGDYKNTVNEQPGSASVVQSVASTLNGIGYSGIGHVTSNVKALALSRGDAPAVRATPDNALDGSYPLARTFLLYLNLPPDQSLSPLVREFVRFTLSAQGQAVVAKHGYMPISADLAARQLRLLGS